MHPQLRHESQLLARRWAALCPACVAPLEARATSEERPLSPTTVYAITKQNQEQLCLVTGRAYSIPTIALRYFNVYGTRQALSNPYTGVCAIFSARLLNDQPPMIFEDGLQTRDFTHVSDIVQANLKALETSAPDYCAINVGTGRATSIKEIALLLARGLGKGIEPEIVGRYREGDIRHCFADIARARRLLGYEPRVAIEQGIPELIDWVRSQSVRDRLKEATAEMESRRLVK
jgi:dTDP-L-rhamnose 4-epimerase